MTQHRPLPAAIIPAQLQWRDARTPLASTFDDVYFSCDDGLAESRYVFIAANGLPERWASHPRPLFVVAETGFGTGLNFLALWQSWRQARASGVAVPRLHFISVEKHPLRHADHQQALAAWPELQPLSEQLLAALPLASPGLHRRSFEDGQLQLDLWYGDLFDFIDQSAPFSADAWFLDGFAPARNPEMWQPRLFAWMAANSSTNTTVATFTAVGQIRRDLQAAGFAMAKVAGFGRKREMLVGQLQGSASPERPQPQRIAVIGGGIAGASLCHALARRGCTVELLYADDQPAAGASGNRQGALYPLLHGQFDAMSQLYVSAFGHARQQLQQLAERQPFAHDWCGLLQLADSSAAARKLATIAANPCYPAELLEAVDGEQASRLAGLPLPLAGIHLPLAGWVSPRELVNALLADAARLAAINHHPHTSVTALVRSTDGWQIHTADGRQLQVNAVILATGAGTLPAPLALPLGRVRGQVSYPQASDASLRLTKVLCHKGYLSPALAGRHAMGASFVRQFADLDYSPAEQQGNLQQQLEALGPQPWLTSLGLDQAARVSVRASVADHLPVAGLADEGVGMVLALGSRGLTSAPLLAELVVALLLGEPAPLPQPLLDALAPQRLTASRYLTAQQPPAEQQRAASDSGGDEE